MHSFPCILSTSYRSQPLSITLLASVANCKSPCNRSKYACSPVFSKVLSCRPKQKHKPKAPVSHEPSRKSSRLHPENAAPEDTSDEASELALCIINEECPRCSKVCALSFCMSSNAQYLWYLLKMLALTIFCVPSIFCHNYSGCYMHHQYATSHRL